MVKCRNSRSGIQHAWRNGKTVRRAKMATWQGSESKTYQSTKIDGSIYESTNRPIRLSIWQCINLSIYQPTDLPTNQPINLLFINLQIYQSTTLPIYRPISRPIYGPANQTIDLLIQQCVAFTRYRSIDLSVSQIMRILSLYRSDIDDSIYQSVILEIY